MFSLFFSKFILLELFLIEETQNRKICKLISFSKFISFAAKRNLNVCVDMVKCFLLTYNVIVSFFCMLLKANVNCTYQEPIQ